MAGTNVVSVSVTASLSTTGAMDMRGYDGGHFQRSAGDATALTWYASVDGETYKPAVDLAKDPITDTIDGTNDFVINPSLNGRLWLKAVAGSGTTATLVVGRKHMAARP